MVKSPKDPRKTNERDWFIELELNDMIWPYLDHERNDILFLETILKIFEISLTSIVLLEKTTLLTWLLASWSPHSTSNLFLKHQTWSWLVILELIFVSNTLLYQIRYFQGKFLPWIVSTKDQNSNFYVCKYHNKFCFQAIVDWLSKIFCVLQNGKKKSCWWE